MATMELQGRMAHLLGEMESLVARERSEDDERRVDQILSEVADLEARIKRERDLESILARKGDYAAPAARLATTVPAAAAEDRSAEDGGVDGRSLGRRFVTSKQYRAWQENPQRRSDKLQVGSFWPDATSRADDALEQRTLVYSGTASASMLLPQVVPTIYRALEAPLVMRQVLMGMRTTSDAVTALAESSFTNNAAEVAEATATNEGAKPESALAFSEATFPVRTVAHWIPVTRQMVEDLPAMEAYINDRLLTGLARREDNQILNGDGSAPNLTGLLNTSGIQNLNAAHFSGNPVVNAGTSSENINRILRAKMQIAFTGYAVASFVVMNPTDWEKFATYSDGDRMYFFGGPGTSGNVPTLWGLPVVISQNITAGTALVGDGSMAAVADRVQATLYMADQHSDYFVRNIFVILAEERIALPVFRAAAFAKVALA